MRPFLRIMVLSRSLRCADTKHWSATRDGRDRYPLASPARRQLPCPCNPRKRTVAQRGHSTRVLRVLTCPVFWTACCRCLKLLAVVIDPDRSFRVDEVVDWAGIISVARRCTISLPTNHAAERRVGQHQRRQIRRQSPLFVAHSGTSAEAACCSLRFSA